LQDAQKLEVAVEDGLEAYRLELYTVVGLEVLGMLHRGEEKLGSVRPLDEHTLADLEESHRFEDNYSLWVGFAVWHMVESVGAGILKAVKPDARVVVDSGVEEHYMLLEDGLMFLVEMLSRWASNYCPTGDWKGQFHMRSKISLHQAVESHSYDKTFSTIKVSLISGKKSTDIQHLIRSCVYSSI
jgi:hypothetical protein